MLYVLQLIGATRLNQKMQHGKDLQMLQLRSPWFISAG